MVWSGTKGELMFNSNPFCLVDVFDLLLIDLALSIAQDGKAMYLRKKAQHSCFPPGFYSSRSRWLGKTHFMIRYGLTACITHFTIYQQLNFWVISDLQSAQEIELHAQFDGHYLYGRPLDPHQHTSTHVTHFACCYNLINVN